ncbi:MAG: phosphatase PAP2 family protein [Pseudomonadota bacterium]
MSAAARLRQMLLGWGCVGLVYFSTGLLDGHAVVLPETAFDRMIAYNPGAIWLYMSFFVLIPYAYMAGPAARVAWLARAMQLCAVLAGAVFVLYPTTLAYPAPVGGSGIGAQVLALLLAGDSPRNCLPSLHGGLTLLCVWALLERARPLRSLIALALGVAICYSIIALRRHVLVDLSAGLLAGLACGALASYQATPQERLA